VRQADGTEGLRIGPAIAWKDYTPENTRLVHHECHVADQTAKGFTDREAEIVETLEEMKGIQAAKDEAEIKVGAEWAGIGIAQGLGTDAGISAHDPTRTFGRSACGQLDSTPIAELGRQRNGGGGMTLRKRSPVRIVWPSAPFGTALVVRMLQLR